jgi:hypothetical protein
VYQGLIHKSSHKESLASKQQQKKNKELEPLAVKPISQGTIDQILPVTT